MGLDANGTRFVLYAKRLGVDFSRSAMIGRQYLSRVSPADLKRNLVEFDFAFDKQTIDRIFSDSNGYAEPFLHFLGAKEVHSFDNSDYEGATHLHDMNQEIPDSFREQYSMVLDGGSMEHVFNFPTAIQNCMQMVRVGGHYLAITPTNNFMGHGFYQFSPELYFSVFADGSGYNLVRVIAFEDKPRAKWYSVVSPTAAHGRVTLTNCAPTYLLIVAKKLTSTSMFSLTPQQSDYVHVWEDAKNGINHHVTRRRHLLRSIAARLTPQSIKHLLRREWRYRSGFDPRFFRPIGRLAEYLGTQAFL